MRNRLPTKGGSALRGRWFLLVCALFLVMGSGWTSEGDRLPYRVGFDVEYGAQPGPESWREEFEFLVIDQLDRRGCFQSVRRYDDEEPEEVDLLLRIFVSHVEENQRFDISQSEMYDPDAPPGAERLFTIDLEADFDVEFRKLPEDFVFRARSMTLKTSHRPRLGEDARYEVRLEMIKDLERALVNLACKGSEKKLLKDFSKAMERAGK